MKIPVVMSWSGGKDCAMALHEISRSSEYQVVALLTTVSEEFKRISHHGVREVLVEQQAQALGLPLDKIYLPSNKAQPCTNEIYEQIMDTAMRRYLAQGVQTVGFGDLFLDDLRVWREERLATVGMRGIFPLWKRDTAGLARQIINLGFKAFLSCVEGRVGPGFAGRSFDAQLLADLPPDVDPCGENGEYHSFVYAGPIFREPVAVTVGQLVTRDGRYYADLLPDAAVTVAAVTPAGIPPVA